MKRIVKAKLPKVVLQLLPQGGTRKEKSTRLLWKVEIWKIREWEKRLRWNLKK
jgi:hypothetical protein